MRVRLLSTVFLTLGLLVGMAAGIGLLVGFEPARLPTVLLNVAAYKLTILAALSLIAAGAVLGRHAQRQAVSRLSPELHDHPAASAPLLGQAQPGAAGQDAARLPEPLPMPGGRDH